MDSEWEEGDEEIHVKNFKKKSSDAAALWPTTAPEHRRPPSGPPPSSSPTSGFRERRELLSLPLCFVFLERGKEGEMKVLNRIPPFIAHVNRFGSQNRTGLGFFFYFICFLSYLSQPLDLVSCVWFNGYDAFLLLLCSYAFIFALLSCPCLVQPFDLWSDGPFF